MPASAQLDSSASTPAGIDADRCERHVFVVCNGEKCRKAGSGSLLNLLNIHRCSHDEPQHDVRIGASHQCIGRCTMAPAMVEDGRVMGWMSLRRLRVELMRLGIMKTLA
jgi:NADH:ubiquinone oxidoreductase subunit E